MLRRQWPFPATVELDMPRGEIAAFVIEDDGDGGTTNRFAFHIKDGSMRHKSQAQSNALGLGVVFEVNCMLGA